MRRSERGANLVEMAIVLPLLVLILAGVVDLGRAFYGYITITNAAREGARAGARLSCYPADAAQRAVYKNAISQAVRDEVTGSMIAPGTLTLTINPDPVAGCQTAGQPVLVIVSTPHNTILAGIIGFGTINLTSSSAMSRTGSITP